MSDIKTIERRAAVLNAGEGRYRRDNIAPDSRLSTIVTARHARQGAMGWMVPVYCLNCGVQGPDTPEENTRHFSYLCNQCVEKYGEQLGTMIIPDQVMWQLIKLESVERYGRELTTDELHAVVEADASPLAKLLKDART